MPDVMFISRQRLVGRTNGSSTYLVDLADAVRRAGMVPHLIQPSPTVMGRTPFLRLKKEMAAFATHRIRGVVKVGRLVVSVDPLLYAALGRAIVAGVARRLGSRGAWSRDVPNPYSVAIPWKAADHRFVTRAGRRADVAVADYFFQTEGLADLSPGTPSAIVMHDLFHARAGSSTAGAVADSVAIVTREAEIGALARADAVVAIQAAEADFVRTNVPGVTVLTAPMAARCVERASAGDSNRLFFVGSNTAPNVVGLRWFLDDVWSQVRARRPAIRLSVAGTVSRAFAGEPPAGVSFLGLVDDLDGCYAEAGVVISPLTFGSGLKIKLIEGMAHGKAMVVTGVTLQGVEDCEGSVVRADTADAFAAALLHLCDDEAAREGLARSALATARERFSPEACYAPFVGWLHSVTGGGSRTEEVQ